MAMDYYSDEQLVQLAVKGDQTALETLVARYLKPVYGFAFKYLRHQADAEDVTQEVFVKVWRNLRKFDQSKNFKPWLYQIAKNTCLDLLKKKPVLPFSNFDTLGGVNWLEQTLVDESQQPEIMADNVLLSDELNLAISRLAPKYGEVVSMYHRQELNFREISETTGEPLNTVKSRYRRALRMLRRIVG